jgi:hypothetical protein
VQFIFILNFTETDKQNNGKATILGDTTRILRELSSQVDALRKENAALVKESHYVSKFILTECSFHLQKNSDFILGLFLSRLNSITRISKTIDQILVPTCVKKCHNYNKIIYIFFSQTMLLYNLFSKQRHL